MPNAAETSIAVVFGAVGLGLIINHLRTPYNDNNNNNERRTARGGAYHTRRNRPTRRNKTRRA